MAKKDKQKLKKLIDERLRQVVSQPKSQTSPSTASLKPPPASSSVSKPDFSTDSFSLNLKLEIIKTTLLIVIILALLIGLYFANQKLPFLSLIHI